MSQSVNDQASAVPVPAWQEVDTPRGPGRLRVYPAASEGGLGLLLSHGAGTGVDTVDLLALAAALPARGFTVALFEQPWRTAGRKVATAPPTLDEGLIAAAAYWGHRGGLVVGGRSAGARSATRCATGLAALGCLALSFPLHPPGKPEKSRVDELVGAGVPTLVVQGERDSMGHPEEFPASTELIVVPAADHGMRVPKRAAVGQDQAMAAMVQQVEAWLQRLTAAPSSLSTAE